MNALSFAWRSLVRQPARSVLGVLGVAAVGALLFDMLLLSEGLIVSMRDVLERTGWDVRVTTTGDVLGANPRIEHATQTLAEVNALPEVRSALALRRADARLDAPIVATAEDRAVAGRSTAGTPPRREPLDASFQGVLGSGPRPWTVLRGTDPRRAGDVVVSTQLAEVFALTPGSEITVNASCHERVEALPPATLRVAGIGEFPFAIAGAHTLAGSFETLNAACGGNAGDRADIILVTAAADADAAAAAISARRPELRTATNEEMLGRFQTNGFTYFRQISAVLTTVTVSFAMLLITVLLTVSVNQRLGEIAALRALGLSQRRVVADVLCESALIVGTGGLLSLPLGLALASYLDAILKRMPGIPEQMHFFVFEQEALGIHLGLLAFTALAAAIYPMRIVARLPIAATLRNEAI